MCGRFYLDATLADIEARVNFPFPILFSSQTEKAQIDMPAFAMP